MSELVLETMGLTKKYKDFFALKNVDMHIYEGDIYGFVGENGAGKTTVIRLVSGLSEPTSGGYRLFGIDSKDERIYQTKKQMGGIIESVSVNKQMTALENLRLQSIVTNTNKTDEELIELIKKVGLNYEEIKKRKAGNFSLGMRQRLGIALSMLSNPKFVLLDEPMNGLDPQGFIEVRELIKKLNEEGVTFLISSHILAELDKICNRIGFISHGKLLEEITIDELHNKTRRKLEIVIKDLSNYKDKLLSDLNITDFESINDKITIYDSLDINSVMGYLVEKNIKVESFGVIEDTIEDYYINLITRGGKDE